MEIVLQNSALSVYLKEIEQYPLLDRESEHNYAVRYREHNDLEAAKILVSQASFIKRAAAQLLHLLLQQTCANSVLALEKSF